MKTNRRRLFVLFFALPWLVVLTVPALRAVLLSQALHSRTAPPLPWAERFYDMMWNDERLAKRFPNDARVLALTAEQTNYDLLSGTLKTSARLRAEANIEAVYASNARIAANNDRLIARFPRETWLVARRLRNVMRWLRSDRASTDADIWNPAAKSLSALAGPAPLMPPPRMPPLEKKLRRQQLQRAIAQAQRARRLDPGNSFFDLMLACFLMADFRDTEALKVIGEGSRKARYDDYVHQDTQHEIAARERVRPLLVEEKLAIAAHTLLPHFASFNHLAGVASRAASIAERDGNHARALRIRGDLARLAGPMMRGRNLVFAGWSAGQMQKNAWDGDPARTVSEAQVRALGLSDYSALTHHAGRFALYARSHGRPDLARETLRLVRETEHFDRAHPMLFGVPISQWKSFMGISPRNIQAIFGLWWLGEGLLAQSVLLLPLWGLLSLLLLGTSPQPIARRDCWMGVAVCALLCAVPAAVLLRNGIEWSFQFGAGPMDSNYLPREAATLAGLAGFALCPVIAGALTAWGVTLWRMWRARRELFATEPRYEGLSAQLIPRDTAPLLVQFVIVCVLLQTLGCWLLVWNAGQWLPAGSFSELIFGAILLALWLMTAASFLAPWLTALCFVGWLARWRLAPPNLRPLTLYALHWYRQTIGASLLAAGALYLMLAVASLPVRGRADAALKSHLQRGEIASTNDK